jgi:DNA replication protein DnaC
MEENPRTFCKACGNHRYVIPPPKDKFATAEICVHCAKFCEKCRGLGYEVQERNGYEYVKRCSCQELPQRIACFNNAKIPARYHNRLYLPLGQDPPNPNDRRKTIPSYLLDESQEKAQVRAHRWAREYKPGAKGLLLMGPPGTGKTLLLCQILRHLTLSLGERCRFVEFSLLIEELKEQIDARRHDQDATAPLKGILRDATVLVIDELGKVRGTEWELSELDSLISSRHQAGKPTPAPPTGPPASRGVLFLERMRVPTTKKKKLSRHSSNGWARASSLAC